MGVDMFIKIGDIKGEAQDSAHKEEIDVLAWRWGLSQSGPTVNIQDLSFTKYIDKSSPNLMKVCCTGQHCPDATLVVRKTGGSPLEYLTITMTDVLVSSVSTGGNGGEDRLTENVTLNFGKVKVSYQPQKKDGSKDGEAIDMTWDIEQNA